VDTTLTHFIDALRNADVRISPAETLDAMRALQLVGYRDRALLKNALGLVLPKTVDEKAAFDVCFDRFFSRPASRVPLPVPPADEETSADDAAGEGGSEGMPKPAAGASASSENEGGTGEQGDAAPTSASTLEPTSALGRMLMQAAPAELRVAISVTGDEVNVRQIEFFTQKGVYTRRIMEGMGLIELQGEINALSKVEASDHQKLAKELGQRRDRLREHVRDYVEQQLVLHADATGQQLREETLRKVRLSNIEQRDYRFLQELVRRMAKRLVVLHSRRRRVSKRGQLHVPRTLRRNLKYDGAIFDLHWRSVKVDRPKVIAICDVSGSVAAYSRFMLMVLYSLGEVMPKVRSFVFSAALAEVTDLFARNPLEEALSRTMHEHGYGSTDYGQAFSDFRRMCLPDVDRRTTIIILGDARNNYGEPGSYILREMYERARRVIWLNPEPRNNWGYGDSEMPRYSAYCHQTNECNSLLHLERIINHLLYALG
jgi:uncharacterized protein with von Willebrand factor type A (vWA) domain